MAQLLAFAWLWGCAAFRASSRSGRFQCSPDFSGDTGGAGWHLIILVNGYHANDGGTVELMAKRLCEAGYGALAAEMFVCVCV